MIALPGGAALRGRTIDMSQGGLSLRVPGQLPVGQACKLFLDLPVNGKFARLNADARVVYSILSGTDGFRTGLQFANVDEATGQLLAELMS